MTEISAVPAYNPSKVKARYITAFAVGGIRTVEVSEAVFSHHNNRNLRLFCGLTGSFDLIGARAYNIAPLDIQHFGPR